MGDYNSGFTECTLGSAISIDTLYSATKQFTLSLCKHHSGYIVQLSVKCTINLQVTTIYSIMWFDLQCNFLYAHCK